MNRLGRLTTTASGMLLWGLSASRWLCVAWVACTASEVCAEQAEFPFQIPSYAQGAELRQDATLRSVAFNQGRVGIACGDRGSIWRSVDGGESWKPMDSALDCPLTSVQWVAADRAVIVGGALDRITGVSRGVVLVSDDSGQSWKRRGDQEMPRLHTLQWEESLLVATGDWSDSLLTNRFESRDRGQSWHAGRTQLATPSRIPSSSELLRWVNATQIPLAIRHACRISDQALCAVGDHGTILVSVDGGHSWTAARGQGRQTAVLFVARSASSVPWGLLGSEALESRQRVALLLEEVSEEREPQGLLDGQSKYRNRITSLDLANQAAVALGAVGADAVRGLNMDLAMAAEQWVAIHRPVVVVVDSRLSDEARDAFFQSATAAGVRRVMQSSFSQPGATGSTGETALHHASLIASVGVLASDLQADAMHWVSPFRVESRSIHLRSLYDAASGARIGESVSGGISLPDGYRLAADAPVPSRRKLQIAQARMQQANQIGELMERSRTAEQFSNSLARILDLTSKEDQFRLSWSFVVATLRSKPSLRGVAFHEAALDQFSNRYQSSSAGQWASLRREVIQNSVEWKRLRSLLSESIVDQSRMPVANPVVVSPFQVEGDGAVKQVSGVSPLVVPKPETIHLNAAAPKSVSVVDLNWEFHPLVLFAREASRLRSDLGKLQSTGEESANLKRLADSDHPWSDVLRRDGSRVILAPRAKSPPRLDGQLGDACWQASTTARGEDAMIRLAYDDDYVYLAIQCAASDIGRDHLAERLPKSMRDQDLMEVDRMGVWIDVDRDLMSSMQLQVTESGRVHDAIDGHPAWQPTWYPAITRSSERLTFEIAILRRDLVDLPITPGESWLLMAKPVPATTAQERPVTAPTVSPNPNDWFRIVFQP